jgi:hypothetical protein
MAYAILTGAVVFWPALIIAMAVLRAPMRAFVLAGAFTLGAMLGSFFSLMAAEPLLGRHSGDAGTLYTLLSARSAPSPVVCWRSTCWANSRANPSGAASECHDDVLTQAIENLLNRNLPRSPRAQELCEVLRARRCASRPTGLGWRLDCESLGTSLQPHQGDAARTPTPRSPAA